MKRKSVIYFAQSFVIFCILSLSLAHLAEATGALFTDQAQSSARFQANWEEDQGSLAFAHDESTYGSECREIYATVVNDSQYMTEAWIFEVYDLDSGEKVGEGETTSLNAGEADTIQYTISEEKGRYEFRAVSPYEEVEGSQSPVIEISHCESMEEEEEALEKDQSSNESDDKTKTDEKTEPNNDNETEAEKDDTSDEKLEQDQSSEDENNVNEENEKQEEASEEKETDDDEDQKETEDLDAKEENDVTVEYEE